MTLFDAIESGDSKALRKLMRTGVDLEQVDEDTGAAPLAVAAESGHLRIVRILLRAGVDPDWGGATTPLEAAALEGHIDIARTLIEAQADVNRPVSDGFTPLITAASTGNLEMVHMLIEAGANALVTDDEGESALTLAKKKGHGEIVDLLESHLSNGHGRRPAEDIFAALEARDLEQLKHFVSRQDEARMDENGRLSPLSRAAELGHVAFVRALLDAGADIEDGGVKPPLFCAAESRHQPVVAVLIEEKANVDATAEDGRTALMAAAASGDLDIVRQLLDAGANTKIADDNKKDALWHAARAGQEQTFTFLLPKIKIDDRKTATTELAIHVETRRRLASSAAQLTDHIHEGAFQKAKSLIANGLLDPDGFDLEGRTPLMLAAQLGRRDLLRMLISAGASFELEDDADGYTALIHAIHSGVVDAHLTVSLLAAAGADLDHESADGRTPLMHTIDRYFELEDEDVKAFSQMAEPLLHTGADIEATDAKEQTAWMRVQNLALREDSPLDLRHKLSRVGRLLEVHGAHTEGALRVNVMTAVADGEAGRVRELVQTHEDLEELEGLPILSMAATRNHWDIVSYLVSLGLDINTPNDAGETILMQASSTGISPIVEQLVQAGADPALESSTGQTAAAIARAAGHADVAKFLETWK